MLKSKSTLAFGVMALVGLISGVAVMASAQSATTTTVPATTTVKAQAVVDTPEPGDVADVAGQSAVDTPEPGDVADVPGVAEAKTQGHAPLGGDGVVSSISGTTIVMGEESNEGGASYTIDASKATVTNNGVAANLSDIKVGAKIFVQGTTSGTNVSATSISLSRKGSHVEKANDTDGSAASEGSESASSTDAGE
jgi:hypothetical protein